MAREIIILSLAVLAAACASGGGSPDGFFRGPITAAEIESALPDTLGESETDCVRSAAQTAAADFGDPAATPLWDALFVSYSSEPNAIRARIAEMFVEDATRSCEEQKV